MFKTRTPMQDKDVISRGMYAREETFPEHYLSLQAWFDPHTWSARISHLFIDQNQMKFSSCTIFSFPKIHSLSLGLFMSPRSPTSWKGDFSLVVMVTTTGSPFVPFYITDAFEVSPTGPTSCQDQSYMAHDLCNYPDDSRVGGQLGVFPGLWSLFPVILRLYSCPYTFSFVSLH